ncbi:MAG: hypothetical protein MUE85_16905 [Microscillaceae bacterium]|jgi:energy-coupling factor transporter ATP-binding protein EcfA2|nr:hypothetical protein [Microscillaceae bacterium]
MIYDFKAEGTDAGLDFDIQLTPNKQVYCFIGQNGCGKTKFLENLGRSLVFVSSIFDEKLNEYKYHKLFFLNKIMQTIGRYDLHIPRNLMIGSRKIKDKNIDGWNFTFLDQISIFREHSKVGNFDYPIVFLGAKNRGYINNIDAKNIKILGDTSDRFLEEFSRSFHYMNKGCDFSMM